MENNHTDKAGAHGLETATLALNEELQSGGMRLLKSLKTDDVTVESRAGRDALWLLVRKEGTGGFALRTAYAAGSPCPVKMEKDDDRSAHFSASTALGEFQVQVSLPDAARPLLHWTVSLTPREDLTLPFWPRDVYPLNEAGGLLSTEGTVHAAQRGLNTGLLYLTLAKPKFGSALYLQNWTALNGFFQAAETIPDGCVGGEWPELGYRPLVSKRPLPKGKETILSDAYLHWTATVPQDPRQSARVFLDLLAGIYRHLDRPETVYYDWPRRAEETLRDLDRSPDATIKAYGHRYLHPYTAAEYPDSMVQLTVLLPIREYRTWKNKPIPLADELRAGVKRFFDPELGTMRRYLPNVGEDKNADEVDSWYLYHPLTNLGRLAKEGDEEARDLFLQSLDFGIKVARHFHYQWPVQFDVKTLKVITGQRKPDEPGQSDAGGLFAYVMLQAYELTGKERFLEEAKKAIQAVKDMEFQLEYQANITAWGAISCIHLWRITGDEFYQEQSHVFLANFFHNCLLWESEIGAARHYPIFLGVTCLHDGPYMALYECYEAFAAFHEYLRMGGEELPESVRLLLTEYCKYTPNRAWYYYPQELPKEILAPEVRNGHIDRHLALPLEDLYADGQPPGQVGQEIYGCGAAFAFMTRSYHAFQNAPFVLYCEYPICELEAPDEPCLSFRVRGAGGFSCRARLIPTGRKPLPPVHIRAEAKPAALLPGRLTEEGHWEFEVSAGDRMELRWNAD